MIGNGMIQAAMTWMDEHSDGDGYFLKLTMCDGRVIIGACRYPKAYAHHHQMEVPDANGDRQPVWVNLHEVSTVEIER